MFAKVVLVLLAAAVALGVVARTSSGAGHARTYVVRPADTLWSIAARAYGGDPRDGVWKVQRRNHLHGSLLRPGQRLVLP